MQYMQLVLLSCILVLFITLFARYALAGYRYKDHIARPERVIKANCEHQLQTVRNFH
jgi:hypothetical protein